jgi:hypothetical protein
VCLWWGLGVGGAGLPTLTGCVWGEWPPWGCGAVVAVDPAWWKKTLVMWWCWGHGHMCEFGAGDCRWTGWCCCQWVPPFVQGPLMSPRPLGRPGSGRWVQSAPWKRPAFLNHAHGSQSLGPDGRAGVWGTKRWGGGGQPLACRKPHRNTSSMALVWRECCLSAACDLPPSPSPSPSPTLPHNSPPPALLFLHCAPGPGLQVGH